MRTDIVAGFDFAPEPGSGSAFPCRILPLRVGPGAAQMALDEAMLDHVAHDEPGMAHFRWYLWDPPALSLGYFQSIGSTPDSWRDVPILRRATGGGAIWHDSAVELTYSFVLPASHPFAKRHILSYRAVHAAVGNHLREVFGLDARLAGDAPDAPRPPSDRPKPFLCFHDRDDNDLLVGDRKVLGGAQRRRRGALLQHGSLLLATSSRTPDLPGVRDLAPGSPADPRAWMRNLAPGLFRALRLAPLPGAPITEEGEIPGAIRDRAESLEREVYDSPDWTEKR